MLDFVIYGKILIDDIAPRDGDRVGGVLGGGGPQAVFGARLWNDSIGFLSRSGTDLATSHRDALRQLGVDLSGWRQFQDIPTPRYLMQYDAEEHLSGAGLITNHDDWCRLIDQPLTLPAAYRQPRAIHLLTELPDEPMVETALALRKRGTLFSLEPLPVSPSGTNWERMLALLARVDIVSPDWPTASAIAKSDDPLRVIRHWAAFGPGAIAVRHGARGSFVWSRALDESWHIPALPVAVVDTTGAGNAYGGGLCVGWTESGDIRLAGCYGAISGSIVVRQVGLPVMSAALRQEARSLLERTVASAYRL